MVFVLTSRKRKPKWERARLKGIRRRNVEKMEHWRGYVDESDGEEYFEEESIA